MPDVNIFDVTKETPSGTWASFEKVGDSVQGTYVGKRDAVDSYGNEQVVYELLNRANNEVINVGVRKSKKPVIDRMNKVAFGQIVGFLYTSDKETKDKKGKFKNIDVREDPKFVDHQWIESQKERSKISSDSAVHSSVPVTDDKFDNLGKEQEEAPFLSDEEYLKRIAELARTKLGADASNVKDKVMEATELPFLKHNYAEIYERLKLV